MANHELDMCRCGHTRQDHMRISEACTACGCYEFTLANHEPERKCTCPRPYRLTHNTWEHKARCPARSTEAYCAHPARNGKHEAYAKLIATSRTLTTKRPAWVCRACGYDSILGMSSMRGPTQPMPKAHVHPLRGTGRSPGKESPLAHALREAKKALRGEPKGEKAQGIGVFIEVSDLRALVEACERAHGQ